MGVGSCSHPAHETPCPALPHTLHSGEGRGVWSMGSLLAGCGECVHTCQPLDALNTNTSVIFIALSNMLTFLDVL